MPITLCVVKSDKLFATDVNLILITYMSPWRQEGVTP